MRIAVIGIGSNSVRMLTANVQGDQFERLERDRAGTRLFGGLDANGNPMYRRARTNETGVEIEVKDGQVTVYNMHIAPYEQGNRFNVDSRRPRKLLLHKREIRKLIGYTSQDGLTLVPLRVYLNDRGLAKLELAVARGKKNYDKRDDMAKKDADRKMQQMMKKR